MEEATKRAVATPSNLPITIDANYNCNPKDGHVLKNGTVTFNVAPQHGCLIHTSPTNAFVNEPTSGYMTLNHGNNVLTVAVPAGTTIYYCACSTGNTCDPFQKQDDGGNTIKVESQMDGGHR